MTTDLTTQGEEPPQSNPRMWYLSIFDHLMGTLMSRLGDRESLFKKAVCDHGPASEECLEAERALDAVQDDVRQLTVCMMFVLAEAENSALLERLKDCAGKDVKKNMAYFTKSGLVLDDIRRIKVELKAHEHTD